MVRVPARCCAGPGERMETRANYLLIGSFVLAATAALIGFVVWFARIEVNREYNHYLVYFEGDVAGLSVGADVRYRGIKVGTVTAMSVSPQDPTRVRVTIEVEKSLPIRKGDVASLQPQGITGVSYINIQGATADSPPLEAQAGEPLPVIPSRPSRLEALYQGAPELIDRTITLVDRVSKLFNEENRAKATALLTDLNQLADTLASRREEIAQTIDNLAQSSKDIRRTTQSMQGLAQHANRLMDRADHTLAGTDRIVSHDVPDLLASLQASARSLDKLTREANGILAENRAPVHAFATQGLNQITRFLSEARDLVASLSRLTQRLQSEGAGFLLRQPGREYQPK